MKDYLLLSLGVIISIFNFKLFLSPSDIAPGGISGIGIILNELTGIPEGTSMFLVQIPLLVLGYLSFGRARFLQKALFISVTYSFGVDLVNYLLPNLTVTDDLFLTVLFGGVLGGIGSGLIFRGRASFPGTSLISRWLQFKTGIPTSQTYLLVDGGIIIVLGAMFGWERAMYAVVMLFIWGMATDYILEGPSVVRTIVIVTDRPGDVGQAIVDQLKIGVTTWKGEGVYSKQTHDVLYCVVNRPEVGDLKDIVKRNDPGAFLVIGNAHQASGGMIRPKKTLTEAQTPAN
jgi:uncharacterized membrane-anchored protein YitT (DUF2179 family)